MIFIILGSQKFQFNRLLIEVDFLIEKGYIKEKVIAQTGYSDYKPINYEYKDFMDKDEFLSKIDESSIIITHGGTGSIINSLIKEKNVIAVPRDCKYNEHVDNHQYEIVRQFEKAGYIIGVYDVDEIKYGLQNIKNFVAKKYISNTQTIINFIESFIEEVEIKE